MPATKKPIKIQVDDEDEKPQARQSKKLKAKAKKPKAKKIATKAKSRKTTKSVKASEKKPASIEDKKRVVAQVIKVEDLEELESFSDKLNHQLGEDLPPIPADTSQKIENFDSDDLAFQANKVKTIANSQLNDKELESIAVDKLRTNRSIGIYKRIAYFFAFLVLALIIGSAYLLFSKVVIVLVPNQERMSNNLIFDIFDKDKGESNKGNSVAGIVKKSELSLAKIVSASGKEVIGKEVIGKAVVYNNYSKSQMLVATTRLLSASGKLFRLKNTVDVPAGGQIEVEIYADEPSQEIAIGPTKFSIPGLWAGLQDKVFAESKEKALYQQKIKKYIVQEDIDNGSREARAQLLSEAKKNINTEYSDYDELIYNIDEDSIELEVLGDVGDTVDEFEINMTADVVVVGFKSEDTSELAKQKFKSSLSNNKELISFDSENIIYSLNNYSPAQGRATINATFEGRVSLKKGTQVFDKENIKGLNQRQLEVFLDKIPDVAGYEIRFYPSFLPDFLKRVPKLPERIEIQIRK